MNNPAITSQITFMFFEDFNNACKFFNDVLGLEEILDQGWVRVWRTSQTAYVGATDIKSGSITVKERGGTLISLTVNDVFGWYDRLKPFKLKEMTAVKVLEDIGLRSFFFKGPEGYDFEIQEFMNPDLKKLF